VIIRCMNCKQKLRLPLISHKTLKVKCPNCQYEVDFDCDKYARNQAIIRCTLGVVSLTFLALYVTLPFVLKPKFDIAHNRIKRNFEDKINIMESSFSDEVRTLTEDYAAQLAAIDIRKLTKKSIEHYARIMEERKSYNRKYALTPREKAQLEMLALASDSTKTLQDIVESVARKAAPTNSEIRANSIESGIVLDIDFDMSELTSGEEGTRTKHKTIDSLRKEVVRLISQVTTDVYEFCRDIDIDKISIGCKHFVNQEYEIGQSRVENQIIYKVSLVHKDIKQIEHNPFLDTYSVSKYFKVEIDEFPNLTIEMELL